MPELPDVELYVTKLRERLIGAGLIKARIYSLFVVRSVDPPINTLVGKEVVGASRMGKRIVLQFEDSLYLVIHLMIAGRLLWDEKPAPLKAPNKIVLAALEFSSGTLILTEAGSKRRASLTLVRGEEALKTLDPGGVEVRDIPLQQFTEVLQQENRTVKRALTDPHWFSGIGNAYSDEILHAARLSPMRLTRSLKPEEIERLHRAVEEVLTDWTARLLHQFEGKFPGKGQITAFRPDFAVHGKYNKPCPVCGKPVQRIVYADNEANYCAVCQNEGRLLADRSLSRLLKDEWPKMLEE